MKKLLSIMLCVTFILGVCAAASASSKSKLNLLTNDDKEAIYRVAITKISELLNDASNYLKPDMSLHRFSIQRELLDSIQKTLKQKADIVKNIKKYDFDNYNVAIKAAQDAIGVKNSIYCLDGDINQMKKQAEKDARECSGDFWPVTSPIIFGLLLNAFNRQKPLYANKLEALKTYIDSLPSR